MGRAKQRASPRVVSFVNRNLESLSITMAVEGVMSLKQPWNQEHGIERRPPYDCRVVAICCMLMIVLNKTYDRIKQIAIYFLRGIIESVFGVHP